MKRIIKTGVLFAALLTSISLSAAHGHGCEDGCQHGGWQMKARVGYNIGGTAPLGLPSTIRSLEAYHLTASVMAGVDVNIPIRHKWGVLAGLYVENKGMDGEVTTKGYRMKLKMDNDELEGVYTGHVRQKVRQWMFTVPVQMTYQISHSLLLKAGPYLSVLFDKNFWGTASDGYLRKDNPTGAKVVMGTEENQVATYAFPNDMRTLQFGVAAGMDWQFYRRFGLSVNLTWGLTGIMKSDFKTVEQTLYPIYGQIGFFYKIY